LQLAELALVKDTIEANLGDLKDIRAQLSALGAIEAERKGLVCSRNNARENTVNFGIGRERSFSDRAA
jgi:hypothetical protein